MIKKFILDLLFPQFCLGCQKEGEILCAECFEKIPFYSGFLCPVCGKRDWEPRKHIACADKTFLKTLIVATAYDGIVRKIIHAYKYKSIQSLTEPLSQLLIKTMGTGLPNRFFGFSIIPIPLHPARLKQRGFNQAELIAKKLGEFYKIPVINNALIRVKNTLPQVEVGEKEKRKENIKNAFACLPAEALAKAGFREKKILLIDDVSSTGATLEEAARVLKNSGAKEIWGIVVAK